MADKTWKPGQTWGNPQCEHYSPHPREGGGEPYICTPTGECCYKFGHPTEECLQCGLARPKEVRGTCQVCGGKIVLWTMGTSLIGGARSMTEKCVRCGQEKHLHPTDAEWDEHSKAHLANDHQRYDEMKANLAKLRKR